MVVTSQNVSRGAQQQHTADSSTSVAQRTYVLDTSVLLSDPRALFRFAEHAVVLPVVVVSELESKRNDPEIGYFARQALRLLDELRIEHERLDFPIAIGDGGSFRVELNHSNQSVLPSGLQLGDNDSRILAVASNLKNDGLDVVVVSKDLPLRVKASSIGMAAEEYRAELAVDSGYTGIADLQVSGEQMSDLYEKEEIRSAKLDGVPVNTGVVIHSERGSALGRVHVAGAVALVRGDREVFGLRGRSAEQRLAIDALLDSEIGIVSLGGSAGTGKSALALCAGLEAVLERQQHKKIMVFRPLYAVGGQDLGFLPGDAGEKMNPWAQAVYDTLGSVVSDNVLDEVIERGLIEVLPLTHIRGRSLHDAFVIVDEAQSLERNVLLTMLSRIGQNSRVVLTHDVAQRDNLRVGRHDGIASVIERLKGHPLFAHVTLTRSERSAIAALVTDLLDSPDLV
ncbi:MULTISPECIES: PhoH family protein [Curtobacterium]|uniref:PhoH family protein n=1 Tax=Curtobacterium TaxID=2034 RepID=UPI0015668E12|nr:MULTISPECIES: PhoH family protein [Curtobacterium]NQX25503.1 PhoH family protein [Curtobacterium sp. VKM Ac-2852]MBT1584874.1 PhoH family protein [Curtobacterium flaccumfaciens pv. flaccumfaciens]MBT1607120.1 PhoH family protein [Curtobacterium flaccumfaciens pv. betae]MBT1631241.1 PhoH family protein [Curtobacterium flaccumfaciens pv. oortii]MBT1658480.1 PhoH family protein [Curtobacterium flaccumfaciens pv. betae]